MKSQIIIAISVVLMIIFLVPSTIEIKAQTVTPPQIEMYLTAYNDAGTLDFVGEEDYDYIYRGNGLILIYVEFYVPNIFEIILSKNGEPEKFWSSGVFENDTVEYIWDTNTDGEGKYRWSFVGYNFAQISVVNSTIDVKIEQGFITPRKLFFGIIVGSLVLMVIAWYINQRSSSLRKKR